MYIDVITKTIILLPSFRFRLFIVRYPSISPRMSKVHNQNQLYNYEEKTSYHSKIHPSSSKGFFWDKEGTNNTSNYQEILDCPKSKNYTKIFLIESFDQESIVISIEPTYPFCIGARGSCELFTLIIITDIRKKYKERMKHIL